MYVWVCVVLQSLEILRNIWRTSCQDFKLWELFFFPLGVIGFRDSRNFARGHDLANPFAYAVVGLQWGTKVGSIHQMGELCSQIVSRLKFLDTCQMERNYIIECCPKTDRKLLYGIWDDSFIFVSQSGDKKAKFRVCEILYRFLRGNPQCRAPKLKHDLNNNNINNFWKVV